MLTTDAFLRRWLVARDWHVDVTYKLLVHHGGWRAHVLGTQGYIPEDAVAKPLRDNTIFLQGRDRQGRGLIIVKVANHHSRGRDLRQMKLFSVYIMEAMVALCDKERNPTCRLSSMFDLTGCGYSNMDAAVMRNILGAFFGGGESAVGRGHTKTSAKRPNQLHPSSSSTKNKASCRRTTSSGSA
jgi:hypothetical protein